MQFTFATYDNLPDLDEDDRLVLHELQRRGFECRAAVWNDPSLSWNDASDEVCVIRSTWEYYLQPSAFLAWAKTVARRARLFNSLPLIDRNWHKEYLIHFSLSSLPVILLFNGEYSHAIKKVPFHKMEEYGGHIGREEPAEAEPDELAVAHRILQFLAEYVGSKYSEHADKPLYARVDLARDEEGTPLLMELELIEPSLFFSLSPGSEKRFADALLARVGDLQLEPVG